MQVIPRQLETVRRERAARLYPALPVCASFLIVALPFEALLQFLSNAALFHMAGLRGSFAFFCATLALEHCAGIAIGTVLAASFENVTMASQVALAVVALCALFSGLLLHAASVPAALGWVAELSVVNHAFRGIVVNEFRDAPDGPGLLAQLGFDASVGLVPIPESFRFDAMRATFPRHAVALFLLGVAANLLACLALLRRRPKVLPLLPQGVGSASSSLRAP